MVTNENQRKIETIKELFFKINLQLTLIQQMEIEAKQRPQTLFVYPKPINYIRPTIVKQ